MFTLYLLYFQINYLQKLPTSPRSYEKGHCHAVCEDRLLWWGKRICSRKVGCMTGPLERRNFNLNTTTSWSTGFNQKHITLGLYNSGSILLCCFSVNCLWYKTHTEDHWKIYYLLFYFFFDGSPKVIISVNIFSLFQTETVQRRVYKSLKLWSMYADLEESLGTFQVTTDSISCKEG